MKKLSKNDLKLKGSKVTRLNGNGEEIQNAQPNEEDYAETVMNEKTDCKTETFNTHCLCFTQGELGCEQSKDCPHTESGGEICCAETLDDDPACVVDTNDGCIVPIEESEEIACNDTEVC